MRSALPEITTVRINVIPGPIARVSKANISVTGAITADPAETARIAQVTQRWRLQPGTPFRQADGTTPKRHCCGNSYLTVTRQHKSPPASPDVDPGSQHRSPSISSSTAAALFRFGSTRIEGLQRYPRQSWSKTCSVFRAGERYSHEAVVRYQTELQASGFFAAPQSQSTPTRHRRQRPPLQVRVVEHPEKKIDLGVGYSTDTGPRGSKRCSPTTTRCSPAGRAPASCGSTQKNRP